MLKKLRKRFICITMSILLCMLTIIMGMILYFTMSELETRSDTMLQTLSQTPYNKPARISLPYFIIEINSRGEIVTAGNSSYDISNEAWIRSIIDQIHNSGNTNGKLDNLKYISVILPGIQKFCLLDISSHTSSIYALMQVCIVIGFISMAAFLCISILLARWTVKPVAEAWQQQKQFISDASHELKTPLTVIISNAELLQSQQANTNNAKQLTDNILTSSQQMRHLVNGMLELARADNGQIRTSFTNINLSHVINDAILPFEPLYYENGLSLQSDVTEDIATYGSEAHLHQLIVILLDNAYKYSVPGIVEITLKSIGRNRCLITVSNPGKPIPQRELKEIFQRFYRSDTARTQNGSYGLGLAIADRIVNEHNGKIWAESNESGNCFFVELPRNTN